MAVDWGTCAVQGGCPKPGSHLSPSLTHFAEQGVQELQDPVDGVPVLGVLIQVTPSVQCNIGNQNWAMLMLSASNCLCRQRPHTP